MIFWVASSLSSLIGGIVYIVRYLIWKVYCRWNSLGNFYYRLCVLGKLVKIHVGCLSEQSTWSNIATEIYEWWTYESSTGDRQASNSNSDIMYTPFIAYTYMGIVGFVDVGRFECLVVFCICTLTLSWCLEAGVGSRRWGHKGQGIYILGVYWTKIRHYTVVGCTRLLSMCNSIAIPQFGSCI